jgi:hypothetical protein
LGYLPKIDNQTDLTASDGSTTAGTL